MTTPRLPACLVAILCAALPANAQTTPAREYPLWEAGAVPGGKGSEPADTPTVTVYRPDPARANGAAVVICPGGGYGHLALDHEGQQVARWLNGLGVTGVVLKYRLAPKYGHPAPLTDAQRALRFTRAQAKEWGLDAKRVGVLGFSAGGHLASTAATHFDAGKPDAADAVDRESCRPDFAVLCYPVITLRDPVAHAGSRKNLLGANPPADLLASLCNDEQVTKDTPPTFLVHTNEDKGVVPENSVRFYLALRKAGVPAELHVFEQGRHGLGLGPQELPFARWPGLCQQWLQARGVLTK